MKQNEQNLPKEIHTSEKTIFDRTNMLIGDDKLRKLQNAKVLVFGVGGVGGYCVEALARAGIGNITIVDYDVVDITNINRQVIALHSTVGRRKVEVLKERILDINSNANIKAITAKLGSNFTFDHMDDISEHCCVGRPCPVEKRRKCHSELSDFFEYDFIVDAIDDVKAKIMIIENAYKNQIPIISCMGTGNKLDPTKFLIADLSETYACPLAKAVRKELRKKGIERGVEVLFSTELPQSFVGCDNGANPQDEGHASAGHNKVANTPASISYMPAIAGLLIASHVILQIIKEKFHEHESKNIKH